MNTNNIQLTQILGTDSLSNSRIVINDNFKILANALNNYQNYFDENGMYSSVIISSNDSGTIDFKTDENQTIMELSSNGIVINGSLIVNGNGEEATTLEEIKTNKITKLSGNADDVITISGDVHIEGDLTVTGETPGGGDSSTVSRMNIKDFNNNGAELGYIETYNKGCYVDASSSRADIKSDVIRAFIKSDPSKILQYVNKPFIVIGKGCRISIEDPTDPTLRELLEKVLTNGVFSRDRKFIICPGFRREEDALGAITEVKIYPLVVSDTVCIKIEFSSVMRQN